MEEKALKFLQSMILRGDLSDTTDIPAVLLPNDMAVQSLETFKDEPTRRRGVFSTHSIEEFASYTKQAASNKNNMSVFINQDAMQAVARLDHGIGGQLPGWGDHKAIITLNKSPEYSALRELTKSPGVSQETLAHFIIDWKHCLRFGQFNETDDIGEMDDMPLAIAYQKIRSLSAQASSLAEHKESGLARSSDISTRVAVSSEPPTLMFMRCIPYDGLQQCLIPVRLSYRVDQRKAEIKLTLIQHARLGNQWGIEFREKVQAHEHLANAHIGTYKDHQPTR